MRLALLILPSKTSCPIRTKADGETAKNLLLLKYLN